MIRETPRPAVHLGLHACQSLNANRYRGIARYVHAHTLHLLRDHRELIAGLHLDPELSLPRWLADFCGYGLLEEHASDGAQMSDTDEKALIFHVMSPCDLDVPLRRLLPPPFTRAGAQLVVTLYDLIPLVYQDVYLHDLAARAPYFSRLKLVQEADHVLALSQTTRDDAVRLLGLDPERITVIYGGVSDYFREPDVPREAVRRQVMQRLPEIRGPYILYTGGIDFRKNMEGTIAAYAHLPQRLRGIYQMVLAAHMLDPEKETLAKYARTKGVDQRLVLPGLVPDELLRALYQACDVFVFPSLYEGLGLPVLEAARCGAPVIVSDRGSMRELVEIDRARFNPEDPSDISGVMERVLTDEELRRELIGYGLQRSRQFTWERVAQVTADSYRAIASSGAQRRTSAPPRRRLVAFCTPFPPEQSGVADYSKRFLETLAARHPLKIDIVVKDDRNGYIAPGHPHMHLLSVRQFRWLADHGHYDTVVYCMGNSQFHGYTYDLLKEHRGVVWLHDVRLTGFYNWYYGQLGRDTSTLPQELLPWARRYPNPEGDLLGRDMVTQHEQGIYLAGEVASHAKKVVVNSRFSQELLKVDSGLAVPTVVIPHAALRPDGASLCTSWPDLASKYGLQKTAWPVVSLGIVAPTKCPEAILDGFAAANPAADNLALVFIGECDPSYKMKLQRRACQLGIADRVQFTGHLDEAQLDSWLSAARCAIQLRFPTNGESSGAVMRCIAAGVPTIVSDHGPLRELPDDAVVKVPAQVEPADLAQTIRRLLADDQARRLLREGALRYAREVSFEAVADQFWTEVLCAP